VPVKITFAQARDWAKLLGGRIVMPQSLAEQRQVVALLGINGKCWIGLLGDGQEDHWLNGVKVGWSCYRRIGNGSRDGAAARPYVIVANIERGAWMAAYANDMAELIIEWDAP